MISDELSNYPPGVSGNEYEIAGEDASDPIEDFECPDCHGYDGTMLTYRHDSWFVCNDCTWTSGKFPEPE